MAEFDPQARTGDVLLDDGRRVSFGAAAFAAGGLRLLRLGQRVELECIGEGTDSEMNVIRVTLPTMRAERPPEP